MAVKGSPIQRPEWRKGEKECKLSKGAESEDNFAARRKNHLTTRNWRCTSLHQGRLEVFFWRSPNLCPLSSFILSSPAILKRPLGLSP